MLSGDVRKQIEAVVKNNDAKIAEYKKKGIEQGSKVAAPVEDLRQLAQPKLTKAWRTGQDETKNWVIVVVRGDGRLGCLPHLG